MPTIRCYAGVLVACGLAPLAAFGAELIVHDAWMREVPPTSPAGAVYLDVENPGDTECEITDVSIAEPYEASLHQTILQEQNRVGMQPLSEIPLGPGERLNFATSGHHVMIDFWDEPAPAIGSKFMLQLTACNAPMPLEVEVEVRSDTGGDAPHHHH